MPQMRDSRYSAKLMVCLVTIYLVWGSSFLFSKIAVNHLPPALFSGNSLHDRGRAARAARALLRRPRLPRRAVEWRHVSIAGFFMVFASNGLNIWAISYIPTNLSALLERHAQPSGSQGSACSANAAIRSRAGRCSGWSSVLRALRSCSSPRAACAPAASRRDRRAGGVRAWALGTLYYRSIDTP